MTIFKCAIYKNIRQHSQFVYYFFKVKKTDGADDFLGWARCKKSLGGKSKLPPEETGLCRTNERLLPLIMPGGVHVVWEDTDQSDPEEATTEIYEHEARIYKDGDSDRAPWMTLTKYDEG